VAAAVALLVVSVIGLTASTVLILREQGETAAALTQAQVNLQTAEEQRERAEANFQKARDAVDSMLTEAAEKLADVPQMEQVRRALLEDALEFYQGFLDERGDDPDVQSEAGRAYRRVGDIRRMLGEINAAEQAYRQSIEVLEEVVADFPQAPDGAGELARSYIAHAAVFSPGIHLGHTPMAEAGDSIGRAIALLEKLTTEYPNVPEYTALLATSYSTDVDSRERKAANNRKAIALWESLVTTQPEVPDYQAGLAFSLKYLGDALLYSQQWDEGEACYDRFLAISEKLVRDHPARRSYREALTYAYHNQGWTRVMVPGRLAGAEEAYDRALTLCRELQNDYPGIPKYRLWLAHFHGDFAQVLTANRRVTEAETERARQFALEEALFADFPDESTYPCEISNSHNATGDGLEKGGRGEAALVEFRRALEVILTAIERFPTNEEVQGMLSRCLYHLAHAIMWEKANATEQELREVVERIEWMATNFSEEYETSDMQLPGHLLNAYACLAATLLESGQTHDAHAWFRRAAELHANLSPPQHSGFQDCLNLGFLLFEAGLHAEAKQVFGEDLTILEARCSEAQGPAAPAVQLCGYLVRCPDPEFQDLKRAAGLARHAVHLEPQEGWCWSNLARVHLRLGDWQAAVDAQEKSFELDGNSDTAGLFRLALARWRLGQKDESRRLFEEAVTEIPAVHRGNRHLMRALFRLEQEAARLLGIEHGDAGRPEPGAD
jgi:tetratricopeptide (TPR) repeat protein